MPQYISALTWRGMFNDEYGAVNLILQRLHLPAVPWLSDPIWAFVAPIIVNIWLGFPFMMVVALGGAAGHPARPLRGRRPRRRQRLAQVPARDLAAAHAGAHAGAAARHHLDLQQPERDLAGLAAADSPADQTHILVTYIYKVAFTYYRYSLRGGVLGGRAS